MGYASQGRSQARDPPRGGRRGGQDDFDTLTGRRPAKFQPQSSYDQQNFATGGVS